MADGLGILSKLALKKSGNAWLTADSPGANDRLPFVSSTLDYQRDQVPNDDINDSGVRDSSAPGNAYVDGNVVTSGDYRQMVQLVQAAAFMGVGGAPALVETGVYKHAWAFQPHTNGIWLTAGADYGGVDVYEFASIKATRRLIQIASPGRMDETFEYGGGGVDKAAASAGWTHRNDPADGGTLRVLHRQMVLRTNAQAGGALGAGDVVYPLNVEIDMNRAHDLEYAQAGAPQEPTPGGPGSVTVRLTFKAITAALLLLFRDSKDSGTALKTDVVLDHGTLLGATQNRLRSFYFPKLIVTDCPNRIPGHGKIPMDVTMTAHRSATLPTGFPAGYTQPVVEEAQNEHNLDPLA